MPLSEQSIEHGFRGVVLGARIALLATALVTLSCADAPTDFAKGTSGGLTVGEPLYSAFYDDDPAAMCTGPDSPEECTYELNTETNEFVCVCQINGVTSGGETGEEGGGEIEDPFFPGGGGDPDDPTGGCDPTIPGSDCGGTEYTATLECTTNIDVGEPASCSLDVTPSWVLEYVSWSYSGDGHSFQSSTYNWSGFPAESGRITAYMNILNQTDSVSSMITVVPTDACGDERDLMAREYQDSRYGNPPIEPSCTDFSSSGGTANFTWGELNYWWGSGNPHPQYGLIDTRLTSGLELTRSFYGDPIRLTSGYRCPHGNHSVGGVDNSWHTAGRAADMKGASGLIWDEAEFNELLSAATLAGASELNSYDHYDHNHLHAMW